MSLKDQMYQGFREQYNELEKESARLAKLPEALQLPESPKPSEPPKPLELPKPPEKPEEQPPSTPSP